MDGWVAIGTSTMGKTHNYFSLFTFIHITHCLLAWSPKKYLKCPHEFVCSTCMCVRGQSPYHLRKETPPQSFSSVPTWAKSPTRRQPLQQSIARAVDVCDHFPRPCLYTAWCGCPAGRAGQCCSGCTLCTELCCPWPCSCQWAVTPQSRCRRIVAALRREVLPQPSEEVQALPGLPYEVVMWSVHVRSSVTTSRYL